MATILPVDDERHILTSLARLIGRLGHTVLRAQSLEEARQQLQEASEKPALLICDFELPPGQETGWDFIQWIRQQPRYEDILAILQSATIERHQEEFDAATKARVICLSKPSGIVTLNSIINFLLEPPSSSSH